MYPYIISDDTVTLVVKGVPFATPVNDEIITAIKTGNTDAIDAIVLRSQKLAEKLVDFGNVQVFNGHVTLDGYEMHGYLVDKIIEQNDAGMPIQPMTAFLSRVERNPDLRVRKDLFAWIEASAMPILPDGRIVAYRLITQDWKDIRTRSIDNSIGAKPFMKREDVDSDPNRTCSRGLHFCNAAYLPHYGSHDSRVVIVAIDPADVCAFPQDYGLSKGRCCAYEVLEEVPRETAATFFQNSAFVFSRSELENYDGEEESYFADDDDDGLEGDEFGLGDATDYTPDAITQTAATPTMIQNGGANHVGIDTVQALVTGFDPTTYGAKS